MRLVFGSIFPNSNRRPNGTPNRALDFNDLAARLAAKIFNASQAFLSDISPTQINLAQNIP